MTEEKIKQILVNNSISWNKTESQDRAEIYVDDFVKELLEAITVTPCCKSDSDQLKSVSKLDYSDWKDNIGLIKDIDKCLYKLNGNYITINEVLDIYDVYWATF